MARQFQDTLSTAVTFDLKKFAHATKAYREIDGGSVSREYGRNREIAVDSAKDLKFTLDLIEKTHQSLSFYRVYFV